MSLLETVSVAVQVCSLPVPFPPFAQPTPLAANAYSVTIRSGDGDNSKSVTIGSSWTRGLALHPVGA